MPGADRASSLQSSGGFLRFVMNLRRFSRNCLTDRPSAMRSMRMITRHYYGKLYWAIRPHSPLPFHLPHGGMLLLEPRHAFTGVFWPDVERYEPDICAFLRAVLKPVATFIDCGANVGFFSIQAGALVGKKGRVISI